MGLGEDSGQGDQPAGRRDSEEGHDLQIREVAMREIGPGGELRPSFLALHASWVGRGLSRWLTLLDEGATRPVVVLGAFEVGTGVLLGAVIGVWNRERCDRFDDLLEQDAGRRVDERPSDGAWHLIAVTTVERLHERGLGLGRLLLGRVLAMLGAFGHHTVCTLSPALGLPELAARWPWGMDDAILRAARADARPFLAVMRLHLGGGARLERVLHDSRRDDVSSARVNLRFCYSTRPEERAAQRVRAQRWVEERARSLEMVARGDERGAALFRAVGAQDDLVWDGECGPAGDAV